MSASDSVVYRIDDLEVDSSRASIVRGGQPIHLKPKPFRLLVHLLNERQRLVSKEELMELFWKDTAVTDDALTQCIAEIRRTLGDNPRNPTYIKNVPRMGYRFVGDVREVHQKPAPAVSKTPTRRTIWIAAGALILTCVGAMALWKAVPNRDATGPGHKRLIALVAFENRSREPGLNWLTEGLPEMLATTLSRSRGLEILSREQIHSRFIPSPGKNVEGALAWMKGTPADAVVVGSFSKLGSAMRVDASVYDSRGSLVAAESINADGADKILSRVDELASRLAARIAPHAQEPDRRPLSSLMTDNLEAYRDYALGVEKSNALQTSDAIALFERAVVLDPEFAMANARIGYAYAVSDNQLAKGRPYLEKAFRTAGKVTEKDRSHIAAWYALANQDYQDGIRRYNALIAAYPNETEAYFRLAALLRGESRNEQAVQVLHRAIAIDPEDPKLYNELSCVLSEDGVHAEAIAMAQRYVQLAPSDANALDSLALAFQMAGQNDRALETFGKSIEMNPRFPIPSLHRAVLYAQVGREREALREAMQHAEHGSYDFERARGWSLAAWIHWRRGRIAAGKAAAAEEDRLLGQVRSFNPAHLLHHEARSDNPELAVAGRGARFGERWKYFYLAQAARKEGRTDEMFANLRKLLTVRANWGTVEPLEDALGDGYFETGRFPEAIVEYERALKVFPGMARARLHLGQSLARTGQRLEAQAQFRQFLERWHNADPGLPELAEARRGILR